MALPRWRSSRVNTTPMGLQEYRRKRDFRVTAEPKPLAGKTRGEARLFVIQKHAASRLHYDFRLEMGGVLKSWAVPKGPPYAKGEKHLAVHVEDHPIDYAEFEGIIPQGQYGGGTVMVWDIGTYQPLGDDAEAYMAEKGVLHLELQGRKLIGEWTLIRTGQPEANGQENWLWLKSGEGVKPITNQLDNQSALTGRTMAQIATDPKPATWNSPRPAQKKRPNQPPPALKFIEPMQAKAADVPPPPGEGWIYELKFDGYRALALVQDGAAQLVSRNQLSLTNKFPALADALAELDVSSAMIDGEIVALDPEGRSSFQLLQAYALDEEKPPLYYYAFDLLSLDGTDWRARPLHERKARLQALLVNAPEAIRLSANIEGDPAQLLQAVQARGLEGIVAKRAASRYEPGRRSGSWLKLKVQHEQEFVIGGYTEPQGARRYFGALIIGVYEKRVLQFVTKLGTGFSQKMLANLWAEFQPLRRDDCPFGNLPTQRKGQWGQGITRREMAKCTWLDPKLVCQVRFTEWTRADGLRHPAFLGMRLDKAPRTVGREASSFAKTQTRN